MKAVEIPEAGTACEVLDAYGQGSSGGCDSVERQVVKLNLIGPLEEEGLKGDIACVISSGILKVRPLDRANSVRAAAAGSIQDLRSGGIKTRPERSD